MAETYVDASGLGAEEDGAVVVREAAAGNFLVAVVVVVVSQLHLGLLLGLQARADLPSTELHCTIVQRV